MRGCHAPAAPYHRERPGTNCTGGWVGLRAGLDWCGKSRPTGIRSSDRPACRQSLYRLRYPAHHFKGTEKNLKSMVFPVNNNTKLLHTIAEVLLYLMHKNGVLTYIWSLDTTSGNFEVGITNFIVTMCPLQFTHCTEIRFLWHCL